MTPEGVAELVMVSAQVPVELRDAFKAVASAHERNVSAEIRHVMRAHVDACHAEGQEEASGRS